MCNIFDSDTKAAEWLCKHFEFSFFPTYHMDEVCPDSVSGEPRGPIRAYNISVGREPEGEREPDVLYVRHLASAKTFPLAVARSVLQLHGLAENTRVWVDG